MISNLDSTSHGVYVELNLIEARAAAILTPHLMRHAPAVFLEPFQFPPRCSWSIRMIRVGKNDGVLNKLLADKLLEQVFLFFRCRDSAGCVSGFA